jgi:hypothetical protein
MEGNVVAKSLSKAKRKPDNPAQSKRFIETAEQVGADDEETLEHAFEKITSVSVPKGKPSKRR